MSDIDLSVITISWNSRVELPDCIRSVAKSAGTLSFEHIVLDNASSDGSADVVEQNFSHAILIRNGENIGFCRGNNAAALRSKGRYVLFLNPDTEVLGDALPRMVAEMERHPDIGILAPKLLDQEGRWSRDMGYRLPTLRTLINTYLGLSRLVPIPSLFPGIVRSRDFLGLEECGWVCGACFMVRREVMARDLWNEELFLFAEDMEYCARVRQRAWRICSTSDARVIHYSGRSISRQSSRFLAGKTSGLSLLLRDNEGPVAAWIGLRVMRLGSWLRTVRYRLAYRLGGKASSLQKGWRLQQFLHLDREVPPAKKD